VDAEGSAIHTEGAEESDVAPLVQMLADLAALENGDGKLEGRCVKSGFKADGSGAEHGDARWVRPGHEFSVAKANGHKKHKKAQKEKTKSGVMNANGTPRCFAHLFFSPLVSSFLCLFVFFVAIPPFGGWSRLVVAGVADLIRLHSQST
jgi:hypothetical protein